MKQTTKVPIIVGVGEIKNPSRKCEDAVEPMNLMVQAIEAAAQDAAGPGKSKVIEHIQSVAVVASSTWPYKDLPGLMSSRMGIKPARTHYSALAGSSPVELVDDTAQLIAKGEIDIGVAVGGESMASREPSKNPIQKQR